MTALISETADKGPPKLFVKYDESIPTKEARGFRVCDAEVRAVRGTAYVYATIRMGPVNPIRHVDGMPEWQPSIKRGPKKVEMPTMHEKRGEIEVPGSFVMMFEHPPAPKSEGRPRFLQTIIVGQRVGKGLRPIIKFGLADDGRAENLQAGAMLTPWVWDGHIDYYGPYARPNTPYDFKFKLDLSKGRMTACASSSIRTGPM